jgi:hypothetical protein
MTIAAALWQGAVRVTKAPAVLLGVFVLTLLMALPLAIALEGMIAAHLGSSLAADRVLAGTDYDWWQEFSAQATGLGATFRPSIVGFAAPLRNLSDLMDNADLPVTVTGAVAAYLLAWLFLSGGIVDRYARGRRTAAYGFFAACGVFFFRFLRLGAIGLLAYAVLFGVVHGWLFDRFYPWATHEVTVERQAFAIRASLYALFGALLIGCNLVLDYARIRAVVEDRRSMIGALVASLRFVARRPVRVVGLYLSLSLLFLVLLAAYRLVAPGAATIWAGVVIAQAWVLARLWLKLVFLASQTALFQAALAHAEYTAAPQPVWPDSPAVETLYTART